MEVKRILVVDDDKSIRDGFGEILRTRGYEIEMAETGEQALSKSRTTTYDLALLDIKLPGMEGTKLLAQMHRERPRMMKIMVTGYASLDNAVEAVNFGADAYVMKPVSPEKLLDLVAEKLKEQEEAERMTEEKVADWVEARLQKLEAAKAATDKST